MPFLLLLLYQLLWTSCCPIAKRRTRERSPSTVVSVREGLLRRSTCTAIRGLAWVKSHFDVMFVRKPLYKVPVQQEWRSLRTSFLPARS
uniref:Putative secreted protein n=1 Tax=Ixodes ricinus TaxID=34613 RepID=A0A147BKH1_IXORI